MAVQVKKVDFSYFRGLALVKISTINEVVSGVVQPYDMTGKTINLLMYDRSDTPVLLYTLPGTVGIGTVSFTFTNIQTDLADLSDFQIIEDPSTLLQYGSANFTLAQDYVPFADIVTNETPPGLVIPDSYITLKNMEWRAFLQKAITPPIADVDMYNESAWPQLMNILIAKLIVFDYILKSLKSFLVNNTLGDQGNGANIKKITTGPSDVEFFDPFAGLAKFFTQTKYGSPLDDMATDLCQLAQRLVVYLPICKNQNTDPTIPLKASYPRHSSYRSFLLKTYGM